MRLRHHITTALLLLLWIQQPAAQQVSSTDTVTVHLMHGTYYSDKFVGRKTSSGEVFTQEGFTAAHKTYKFGTLLLVTNPNNGKQVIVRVNDRCPRTNVLDLTRRAARRIGISSRKVQVQVLSQRYLPVWESQGLFEDMDFSGLLPDITPKNNVAADTKQTSTKATDEKQKLYDLQLLPCCDRAEAERQVLQLPVYHQDNIRYQHCETSSRCRVVLELATHRSRAESIRKQLSSLFPEATLVEVK